MENIDQKNIFNVYSLVPGKGARHHSSLLGSVVVTPSQLVVLADYQGVLGDLNGPADDLHLRRWRGWTNSSHARVVSRDELTQGRHPDLMPEIPLPKPVEGEEPVHSQWFRVERPELKQPHLVEFRDGVAHLHGQPITGQELQGLLDIVRSGRGRIRHHDPVEKAEQGFADLVKADKYLHEALAAVKAASEQGHLEPGVQEAIHKALFYDYMNPGIKNKKAYLDEIEEPRPPGTVHVMLDGSSFGSINKTHGQSTGDDAIKAMGTAIRSAADETVGPQHQELYRHGGDEYVGIFPSHEHASRFLRTLRSKLEAVPPIGGTHALAMQGGIGSTPKDSESSLLEAKKAKKSIGALPGLERSNFHSLVPGHEGHIPLDPEVPVKPPEPIEAASPGEPAKTS